MVQRTTCTKWCPLTLRWACLVWRLAHALAALQCRAEHDWEAVAAGPDTAVIDVREPGELKAVRNPSKWTCIVGLRTRHALAAAGRESLHACDCVMQLGSFYPLPNSTAVPGSHLCSFTSPCPPPQTGSIPGALNLPISAIRGRLDEVPKGKKLYVHCAVSVQHHQQAPTRQALSTQCPSAATSPPKQPRPCMSNDFSLHRQTPRQVPRFSALQVGLRGYNVCRQLRLLGYDAVNLTGGWKTYQAVNAAGLLPGGATNGAAKL